MSIASSLLTFQGQPFFRKPLKIFLIFSNCSDIQPFLNSKHILIGRFSGNIINAIGDVRAIAKLTNDNTGAYLKLSQLHYIMGEEEESLK